MPPFRRLSDLRLRERKALFGQRLYSGAYYLAGYSVECALKACICKNMRRAEFPPDRKSLDNIYTHDLDKLITGAGLMPRQQKAQDRGRGFMFGLCTQPPLSA